MCCISTFFYKFFLLTVSSVYGDITTGSWFKAFCDECKEKEAIPIALDIYYDDWKIQQVFSWWFVFHHCKYAQVHLFSSYYLLPVLTCSSRHIHWQVKSKYLIALLPYGTDLQEVIPTILGDISIGEPPKPYDMPLHGTVAALVRIARVIGDTPGISSFFNIAGHTGHILELCALLRVFVFDLCTLCPCRLCTAPREQLFDFTAPFEPKTQADMLHTWQELSPFLGIVPSVFLHYVTYLSASFAWSYKHY